MQQANLYQQYKTQSLETLTPGEVIVKLFEEASKQISIAVFLIGSDQVRAFNCIMKTQKIIRTLNAALDMKYSISKDLNDMYMFLHEKLGEASVRSDAVLLKELLSLIDDLKTTFKQADKQARVNR